MNPTALTEMVDRVFDDRYRVDEIIGVGAVSAVFSAFDLNKDEWVALKVFDADLGSDEQFVERLLEAAEQASVLIHPHIVETLDWGFDSGPYIVSELCEGGSLAGLLDEGHRLAASQALVMTLECTRALNYGHEQGAIHRNLTPRNVLFTLDHHVRISDYGLSKVLAEAPAAQATRALENVRYASPEQARGRPVGEASDLYSLALVVSEAVSGIAPHVSETVVGTLMERAESPALLASELGELLPPLERCGRVEPDQRPEAEELGIALLATAEAMPRPQPLPVTGIGYAGDLAQAGLLVAGGSLPAVDAAAAAGASVAESGAGESSASETLAEVRQLPQPDVAPDLDLRPNGELNPGTDSGLERLGSLDELSGPEPLSGQANLSSQDNLSSQENLASVESLSTDRLGGLDNLEQADPVFAEIAGVDVDTALDVPEAAPAGRSTRLVYEEIADDADDRLPWWPLALLLIVLAGAAAAWVFFVALADDAESAVVPDLIGVQFDELAERFEDRDWEINRLEDRVDGAVFGSVVAQDPAAGEAIETGDQLTVTVSLGNPMVEIPSDIVGLTVEQAGSRLGTVGLIVGRVSPEQSEAFASGLVIGLDEPTTQMPTGEGVDLRVSSGPEDRVVPLEIIGLDIGDATSLLVGLRLQAFQESTFDPEAVVGTVLGSSPPGGELVAADSAVTLFVSAGPEPVEMPDIIDLQLDEAIDVIEELGLIFIDTTGTPGEEVIGSLPPIGAIVDVGTEVTIILNDPSEDDEEEEDG